METKLLQDIRKYTGFSKTNLNNFIKKAPYSYKLFSIPKKSRGFRQIAQPTRETKSMQYALTDLLFSKLPIHKIAYAYRPIKSPIRKIALLHKDTEYTLKLDFTNFFPSIKFDDLQSQILNNKYYKLNEKDLEAIRKICFLFSKQNWILSIGAPSSPIISNLVMYNLDKKIEELAFKANKNAKLSRYADDIAFSSNEKEASKVFLKSVKKLLENTQSPNLSLNEMKTFFLSRASRRRLTGLIITPDGKVSIGRSRKRKIKSLINSFKYNLLDIDEIYKLQGYLNFVQDVEPNFYTRLIIKYKAELIQSIFKNE